MEMTEDEVKARAQISAEVFGGVSAATAPEPEKPEVKSEPVAEAKPEPQAQEPADEWAGVSPALRAKFEQLSSGLGEVETVKARLKQAEQRLGAATNELSELKKKPQPVEPPKEHESAVKLREQYPEMSTTMEDRLAAISADVLAKVPTIDEKTLAETVKNTLKAEIAFELAVERVEEAHPGWQQEKETPEFRQWQKTASPEVQKLAMSARATDAIKMLDVWKESKKPQKSPAEIEAARLKRLEQAQATEGRKLPVAKAEADMTEAELRAHIAASVWKT